MDRISGSTVSTDLFGTGKNGFKDGNKASGIIATIVSALFMNGVQEEALAIIEAAGLTPNATDRTQILQALRAAGVFQTAAQFDNTTKAATTAFVQRALGNYRGVVGYAVNTALTVADVGKLVYMNGSANITATLPAPSAVPSGAKISILNLVGSSFTCTVSTPSGTINSNGAAITSRTIPTSAMVSYVSDGASTWYEESGAIGQSSLTVSGYQKLPSGLIFQWGRSNALAQGANQVITLPITYPSTHLRAFATPAIQIVSNGAAASAYNTSTSQVQVWNTAAAAIAFGIDWFSIGI